MGKKAKELLEKAKQKVEELIDKKVMVKKICKKDCGDIVYELVCFEGDNKFVIYKIDKKKVKNTEIQEIPEIATFESEKEAKEYFDKLS